jgi:hypothetical protein
VSRYEEDLEAAVFFRTPPDANGNIVSPVASAFEHVSFVNVLRTLALEAETVRAQPTLVTQSMPRTNVAGTAAVDAASLFFDSESRALQQQSAEEETTSKSNDLRLATQLAAMLNRERTTNPVTTSEGASAPLPQDRPPRLFALPEKQVAVPNAMQTSARTDLEQLLRSANEAVACAMGVPASVIFEGAIARSHRCFWDVLF